MVAAFYRFVLRQRVPVLGTLLLCVVCLGYASSRVRIESRATDLFPSTHPYVATFHAYSDTFGNANRLVIMLAVERGTIFEASTLKKIQNVHRALELLPGVNKNQLLSLASRKARVATHDATGMSTAFVMWPEVPTTEDGVRAVRQAVVASDFLYGTLVSTDEKAALVVAEFFEHNLDAERIYEQVHEIIARESDENVSLHAVGRPMPMTYALMGAAQIGLDVNALPVVALGVGLGVDYGLYVVGAIRERLTDPDDLEAAVAQGIRAAGEGVLVAGLTMILGLVFWRFSFLRFQAEMGMLLLFWMLMSMLGGLVLLPALLARFRPRFLLQRSA